MVCHPRILGQLGSLIGGISAALLALAAIIGGSAGLSDWRAKQQEQRALAREEAENLRLDRQRILYGWSQQGLPVYGWIWSPSQPSLSRPALSWLRAALLNTWSFGSARARQATSTALTLCGR